MHLALRLVATCGFLAFLAGCKSAPSSPSPTDEQAIQMARAPRRAPPCEPLAPQADPLPERPSRQDIIDAMRPVGRAVAECAPGEWAIVSMDFKFSSDGCLARYEIAPPGLAQTTTSDPQVWNCMLEKAPVARLPPFTQKFFKVRFPFRFDRK